MTAEVIKQVVPFGIIGLAIVAIVFIVLRPISKNPGANLGLAIAAILIIGGLAIFDKTTPSFGKAAPAAVPSNASASAELLWVDTGITADWGGRDIASTTSSTPQYKVQDTKLCEHDGAIATCWQNRPNGYPPNVPTDISGAPPQWCTYKDSDAVKLNTPPDGYAPRGHVYLCAHTISRS